MKYIDGLTMRGVNWILGRFLQAASRCARMGRELPGAIFLQLALFGTPCAMAADWTLPVQQAPYIYNWSGMYIGATAGYQQVGAASTLSANRFSSFNQQSVGEALGSVHVGYNVQMPGWLSGAVLVGLEGDIGGSLLKQGTSVTTVGGETFSVALASSWLSTFRGRVGVPFGPYGAFLVYGTGGVALGRIQYVATVTGPVSGILDASSAFVGWTAGAGVEFGFAKEWSWRAEYLYVDTGAIVFTTPSLANGIFLNTGQHRTMNIIRTGISWNF
jgi:outer membrane immunogenic protein